MEYTDKNVLTGMQKIFKDRFRILFDIVGNEDLNKELLGNTWGLKARDLVYLLFDVENEFSIKIPEQDIADGKFNTIENICTIIAGQLIENKEKAAV